MVNTKEGVEVNVGQVWQDLDKRMGGRKVRIEFVWWCTTDKCWKADVVHTSGRGRRSTIKVPRMHNHSTGWKLIRP